MLRLSACTAGSSREDADPSTATLPDLLTTSSFSPKSAKSCAMPVFKQSAARSVQAISCSLCSSNQLLAPSLLPHARCTLDPTSAHTCATQTHYHNTQLTQNLFTHEQHRLIVSATTDSSPLPSHPPPLLPLCSKRICTVSAREKQGRASERAR